MIKLNISFIILLYSFPSLSQSCDSLFSVKIDKFKNLKTYNSEPFLNHVTFTKVIPKNNVAEYYMSLHTTASTILVGEKGVILLLENGTKISKQSENIDAEVNQYQVFGNGDYEYRAFCTIKPSDILKLSQSTITDFQLYIFEQEVPESERELIKQQAKCLTKLK